jgi:hypothetical protein
MSSTYSNVVFRDEDVDTVSVVKIGVASATVLAKGDLVDASGATAPEAVAHSGDNSTFIGVAMEGSQSGEVNEISVATRCKIKIKVAASPTTNVIIGDACAYSAGANGTTWEVTKATSEGIMWALENVDYGESGLFLVDSHSLAGGFYFDTCTEG